MQNICVSENTRSRSLTQIFCFSELAHKHIHDGRTRHDRQIRATPRRRSARAGRGAPGGARIAAGTGPRWATVPAAAARAGVTPSTIYRRWGDLSQLLADVAVEQLQPEQAPPDTGSFYGDLLAWLEQYFDEMSSVPGRARRGVNPRAVIRAKWKTFISILRSHARSHDRYRQRVPRQGPAARVRHGTGAGPGRGRVQSARLPRHLHWRSGARHRAGAGQPVQGVQDKHALFLAALDHPRAPRRRHGASHRR